MSSEHKGYLEQLESILDLYFVKKAPALPKKIKEIIVVLAPWLVIIGVVIVVPAILSVFGINVITSQISNGYPVGSSGGDFGQRFREMMSQAPDRNAVGASSSAVSYLIIASIAVIALELFALPGLFARKKQGWRLIFYSSLVNAVSSVLSMNIAGFIIGTILSLYLLFQIKEFYR